MEFLPLVGIVLLFWLFIIRPASRRQKELGRMQSSLSVGDEVVLTSGVFGTVDRIEDDRLGVQVADGVVITVARGAIGSRIEPQPEAVTDSDEQVAGEMDSTDTESADTESADTRGTVGLDAEDENGKPGGRPEGN